jgi:transcription termination/antitermination protein NusA
VTSESQYNDTMKQGYESLRQINAVDAVMADLLFEKGFYSAEEIASAEVEDFASIRGIDEDKARELIAAAQAAVEENRRKVKEETTAAAASGEEAAPTDTDAATQNSTVPDGASETPEPPRDEPTAS